MPQIVRFPNMSLSVANSDAVDGPVAGSRVGHHRADHHLRGGGEDPRVDHERLLPEHAGVEGPDVAEAESSASTARARPPPRRADRSGGRGRCPRHSPFSPLAELAGDESASGWPSPCRRCPAMIAAAAGEDALDTAGDLHALVAGVVDGHVVRRGGDRLGGGRVVDDDVGVRADGDRALLRVEAEDLRRRGRGDLDEAVHRDLVRRRTPS